MSQLCIDIVFDVTMASPQDFGVVTTTRAAVLAAVLVSLPSIGVRFSTDDYGFRALLHAPAPVGLPATDLFRFTRGQPEDALRVRLGLSHLF